MIPLFTLIAFVGLVFFSTLESAYHSANKLQLELEGHLGKLSSKVMAFFAKHPSWLVGTILVGSTVCLVIFTALLSYALYPLFINAFASRIAAMLMVSISAAAIVIIGSTFVPKVLGLINPNQLMSKFAVPFYATFIVLFPLTFPIVSLTRFLIVRVLRAKYDETRPFFAPTNLKQYLLDHQPPIDEPDDIALDKEVFHNALRFKTVKIRDCMIPRTEITAVELSDSIETLREAFVESGHSKVIIFKQSIDEIIGYCHSSSLFKNPDEIREILTPIINVAETTSANELMIRFIREQKSLAVVIDEFGGTSGIVSMEDIIEEIFGEIDDEPDEEDRRIEQKVDQYTYLFSARLEIDYLNETYSLGLPTGEYETLGGLILANTGDFPKEGQTIELPPFQFIILATGNNRIDTVRLQLQASSSGR